MGFRVKVRIKEKKPDYTDDWMNPKPSQSYVLEEPKNEMEYLIERQRRIICFGNPGFITRWEYWDKFKTEKERDIELKKLSRQYPMWQLRARNRNPYLERLKTRF